MIIGSTEEYELNTTVVGLYKLTPNKEIKATIFILRKATKDEWVNYRKSMNAFYPEMARQDGFYYEVSTD